MNINEFIKNNEVLGITKWEVPKKGFVYFICEDDGLIIYVGTTMNLPYRINTHQKLRIQFQNKTFFFLKAPQEECLKLELKLILELDPKYNKEWGEKKKRSYNVDKPTKGELKKRRKKYLERNKKLVAFLEKKKISQSELAKRLKVTRQRASELVKSKHGYHPKTIKMLEKALKVKVSEFY